MSGGKRGNAAAATTNTTENKRFHFEFLDQFEPQIKQLKKVASHLGLYCGLILYTAVGAWIFILIEHPVERAKLDTLQGLLVTERANFLHLVYNLTSLGHPDSNSNTNGDLYSEETIKSMLLATNKFRPHWQKQEFYSLESMVHQVDEALLAYERTVAVAAGEGINVVNKEVLYKWTYIQSMFFSSTIITTVGYGHIAPVTVGGRVFCILFAIIGIPFTLSVIADVGQITATVLSTGWSRAKPVLTPVMRWGNLLVKLVRQRLLRRRKRRSPLKEDDSGGGGGGDANEEDSEDSEEDDDDPMDSIGIATNVAMAFAALGFLVLFLSIGAYVFTHCERWSFFEAFYFCFITMTTIGFGDIVPTVTYDSNSYMLMCMIYILVGLAVTSTIIELVRRQYAESWQKMQELRAQIQAQLKLADHLRKMAEQGKDLEGMDVDLDELRANLNKLKKGRFGAFLGDFDLDALDCWINNKRKVKAVTIFFYETSL